jgi:tetratricopeptide (TPR) repeat protein
MLRKILVLTVAFLIVLCGTIAGVVFFSHDSGESRGEAHPAPSDKQADASNHEATPQEAPEHPVVHSSTTVAAPEAAVEHSADHEAVPAEVVPHAASAPEAAVEHPADHEAVPAEVAPHAESAPEAAAAHPAEHEAVSAEVAPHAESAPEAAAEHPSEHGEPRIEHSAEEAPSASTMRSGPAHDVARAALSNISPAEGLRQLEAALALPHTPEQAALLHEARGELYTQLAPPDFAQAQAAFELALEKTSDEGLEEEIRYKAVQMLMLSGNNEEAAKVARAQLDQHPPRADAGFKLQLLQGQLQERAGQSELAEKNYRSVLDAAAAKSSDLGLEASLSLARMAALRLTQFYRGQNRAPEAEAVVADLKKYIGRMRGMPEEAPEEG